MVGKAILWGTVLVLAGRALTQSAIAQMLAPPPLDPETYSSPSKSYALWVNPSDPDGAGKAFYRLSKSGRVLWEKELPFSLTQAGVDDSGRIGGFASGGAFGKSGYFEVVLIAANGRVILDEKHALTPSENPDTPSNPLGLGIIMDGDRLIVRIANPRWDEKNPGEAWWTYFMSLGIRGPTLHPGSGMQEGIRNVRRAMPLPGTPLILIDWWRADGVYTLVNSDARRVWRLDVAGEFERTNTRWVRGEELEDPQERGGILSVGPDGQFELRHVAARKRVIYQATQTPAGWKVAEISRSAYQPPVHAKRPLFGAPIVDLKLIRKWSVPLGSGNRNPVRDVEAFTFIGANRAAVLRRGDSPAIVVTSMAGKVSREIRLPVGEPAPGERRYLTWSGGSRLILVRSGYSRLPGSKAWAIDADTGRMSLLPKFVSAPVQAIAGFRDGRLAVVAENFLNSTIDEQIKIFDRNGKTVWEAHSGGAFGQEPNEVQGPADIAVDSRQHLVVLNQSDRVQYFDESGHFLRAIDFRKGAHGGNYMTVFALRRKGTIDVAGLNETYDGYRPVDQGGKIGKAVTPRLAQGKHLSDIRAMHEDSAGNLWLTNGEGIFRLNSSGRVMGALGDAPSGRGLSAVEDLHVSSDGAVVVLDRQSAEIHYFDALGRSVRTGTPLVGDYHEEPPRAGPLSLSRSGDVFVGYSESSIHYSPTGRRIGKTGLSNLYPPGLPPLSFDTSRWERSKLIDEGGRVIKTLNRWPDLAWMVGGPTAVAPDGSLMSAGSKGGLWGEDEPNRIAFFSASGKAESLVPLPPGLGRVGSQAYDGTLAYLVRQADVVAIDKHGKPLWRFNLPPNKTGSWNIFPSRGGIALWDGRRTVYWYKIP